jgi:micrococcal nuclease
VRQRFARSTLILMLLLASAPQAYAQLVTRVVDGDTLIVQGVGRVRLIGVDTPETVDPHRPVQFFGKDASVFTHRMAQGQVVRLEFDVERKDRFGRTLAYVYLPDDTFLNAEIVKQGYGHVYTQFPFRYLEQFQGYEREARDAGRGLWAEAPAVTRSTGDADVRVWVNTSSRVYHCPRTRYYGKTKAGAFMRQDEAQRDGYRAAAGLVCQ